MTIALPGIIRAKVVAKNILLGSLGTQHQPVFAMWCIFLKKHTNFLNQTVTLSVFHVKQCTSLIYVKEKSFCLVNWAFPFAGPEDTFHVAKLRKYFMHMRFNKKGPHQRCFPRRFSNIFWKAALFYRRKIPFLKISDLRKYFMHMKVKNPIKHLRWSFLQK